MEEHEGFEYGYEEGGEFSEQIFRLNNQVTKLHNVRGTTLSQYYLVPRGQDRNPSCR